MEISKTNKCLIKIFVIFYNINNDLYERIKDTEVIDPLGVIINSIVNSISIAGMLLTTTSLVINEYQNNSGKINSYTEL